MINKIFTTLLFISILALNGCSTDKCKDRDQFGMKKKGNPSEKPECRATETTDTSSGTNTGGGGTDGGTTGGGGSSGGGTTGGGGVEDFGCGPSCNGDCQMLLLGGESSSGNQLTSVYSSTDGVSWTLKGNLPAKRVYAGTAIFAGKVWLLGGHNGSGGQNNAWSSQDGVTWSATGSMPSANTPYNKVAVFNNQLHVVGGGDASNTTDNVMRSADGITWSTSASLVSPVQRHIVDVLAGKLWVWGGVHNGVLRSAQSSVDGSAWTAHSNVLPGTLTDMSKARLNGKIWIAGGNTGSTIPTDVMSSSDGLTWSTIGQLPSPRRYGSMLTYKSKLWYIGGIDDVGGMNGNNVWSSSDGITWSSVATLPTRLNGAASVIYSPTCGTGSP